MTTFDGVIAKRKMVLLPTVGISIGRKESSIRLDLITLHLPK